MSTLCAHLVSCLTGSMSRRKRRFSQRLRPLKSQTESIDGSWRSSRTKDYVVHKIENGQLFWFDGDKWPVRKSGKNRFVTDGNDESWTIELRGAGTLFWIDDAEDNNIWHRVDEQEVSVNLSLQNIHFSTCRNKKKYRTSQQVEENSENEDEREQEEEEEEKENSEDEDEREKENSEDEDEREQEEEEKENSEDEDEREKEEVEENKEKDSGNYNFLFSKIYIL